MRRVAPAVGLSLFALTAVMTTGCDMDAAYYQTYGFAPGALPVVARPAAASTSATTSPALRYATVTPPTTSQQSTPRLTGVPVVLANDSTFDREYSTSPVPVVINFTAKWCGPCHGVSRSLDQLAVEKAGRVKVLRIDFDQSPGLVRRYNISALPAVLVVRDGVVVKRMVGSQSRENLSAAVGLVAP